MTASPAHVTLVANTVTTITLDGQPNGSVEVLSVDGAAPIYFTLNGDDPAVEGNGSNVLPAAIGGLVLPLDYGRTSTVVKLISAGTPKVSVRRL